MKNPGEKNRHETELDYRKRINQAMLFIQDRMATELSIPDIAASANFSPFHFHRIFTAFVGETVGNYIKRVRMTRASSLIADGQSTRHIASEVGYKTSSAFIQVFKKTFGSLPSEFRDKPSPELTHFPAQPTKNTPEAPLYHPEFRDLPDLKLFYIRKKGSINESFTTVASQAFDELHNYLEKNDLLSQTGSRLGILQDIDLINSGHSRFDACVVVSDQLKHSPKGIIKTGIIGSGKCAVFLHKGPYDTLWQTWSWIYRSWYPSSGLKLREASPFEVYLNNKRNTEASKLLTEINIPLH